MERAFLKGLGLEKEVIDQIMTENGKDIELEKGKAKEIQSQLDTATNTIKERDKQLETLKNSPDNPETLKQQIAQLQADNQAAKEAHEKGRVTTLNEEIPAKDDKEVKTLKVNSALEKALTSAKAKNAKAVQALLELGDDVELNDEGNIKGLDEKIKALKKSDAYLFESEKKKTSIDGTKPGEGNQGGNGKKLSEKSYEDFLAEVEAETE